MDAASHELSEPHERMRRERGGDSVIDRNQRKGAPVFEHEGASFPLKSAVGG